MLVAGRRGRQGLDGRCLVGQLDVGVHAQRQPDVRMPGERLGHFGREAGPLQVRDEQVPQAVEVGVPPGVAAVAQKIRPHRGLHAGPDAGARADWPIGIRPGRGSVVNGGNAIWNPTWLLHVAKRQRGPIRLADTDIERCVHSPFNTRKRRDPEQVRRLAEPIRRNGFERTRSLWGVAVDGQYDIFASGTRLEAARTAGLRTVPVFVHRDLTEEQISPKADEDNENDEYHTPVSLLDVWAECHRLATQEGWTQQRIADAKGWGRTTVSPRIQWHTSLPEAAKQAVQDNLLDEGHLAAISWVVCDVAHLRPWLTTQQAQTELVTEILPKRRGSSAGKRPTVRVVREAAGRWKALVRMAGKADHFLPEGIWRERFVEVLAHERARTESAVSHALRHVVERKRRQEEAEAARLRAEADAQEQEALPLQWEQQRLRSGRSR